MTFDFRLSSLHTTESFGRVSHHKLEGKRVEYLNLIGELRLTPLQMSFASLLKLLG